MKMQRKLTKPQEPMDDLPALTPQQTRFVEGILAGKTATDAYREAYDCSNSKDRTVWAEASRLRANHNVAAWIASARKAHLGNAQITLEQHIKRLDELRQLCIETGNLGAAVQAEQLMGKARGHYVERMEMVTGDPTAMLREIAAVSPALAAQLAKDNDIAWAEHTEH